MNETKISWNANENELIEPFKTSGKGLEACALRLRPSESFNTTDTRLIMTSDFWEDFKPALRIEADLDELACSTGLGPDEIMLSVVIRDRELNKFAKAYQCQAQALPTKPVELTSAWSKFSRSGRADVSIVATPLETVERELGIAFHKGDVIARRTFKIRNMTQSSQIPTRWVSPEEFKRQGTSRDTVWLIHWLGIDLERPPIEVVEILFNDNLREAFQVLENDEGMSNLFCYEMTAAIFTELAIKAVGEGDKPVEETGLRKIMFEQMSKASNLTEDEIIARSDLPNFSGTVHAWAQHHVGLNNFFAKL